MSTQCRAQAYIDWLGNETAQRYRLPSEAELEYVALRGGIGDSRASGAVTQGGNDYMSERFRLRGLEDQACFTVGFRLARSVPP